MSLRTYIKNTADPVYSKYIRIKEADRNGYCTCVTCGTKRKWNDKMDAGHCITRARWATRYDDRNVHPQCSKCNRYEEGRKLEYVLYLQKRYCPDIVDDLIVKSRKTKTFTLNDLKKWVKEWRAEINKMATVKII